MKVFILMFLLIVSACTSNNIKNNVKMDYNLDNTLSFNDYKTKLKKYTINAPYPKIND